MTIKIAAITEDGVTISSHFGRAPYYAVLNVEEGQVVKRELRDKLGHLTSSLAAVRELYPSGVSERARHRQFAGQEGHEEGGRHGYGPGASDRHIRMAEAIADCDVLLCRGMGWGAYEAMKAYGIRPIVTDIAEIEAAVQAYLDGEIIDHTEQLH